MINELREHPAVKAYCQHGFRPGGENDDHIYGDCPFCSGHNKLYVNKETKNWDCKVCHCEGGFIGFLEHINEKCISAFKGPVAIQLSKDRVISLATLRNFNVGYNAVTKKYTVPIRFSEGDRLHDLKYLSNGKLYSTYSCKSTLFNYNDVTHECTGEVWLCEGEWDGMAMWEILRKTKNNSDAAIAVPGSGTFKTEWVDLFRDKKVNVLYDNDAAGQKGAAKVYDALYTRCRQLKFLHWSDQDAKGYDIRDLYHDCANANVAFDIIKSRLFDLPKGIDDEKIKKPKKVVDYTGTGLLPSEVYDAYKKWLYIPDTDILDVLYGAIIANRLSGEPIWLFIVAPPGMTKSEYVQSISDAPNIESISKLTPRALVSGFTSSAKDPSLLGRIDNKVLAVKDFTAIFGMNQQARDEIFSTLRDAYDGSFVGVYGHSEKRYKAKFGIVAGVTPAIQSYMENESSLGERFLRFETKKPKTLEEEIRYMTKASSNIKNEEAMHEHLRDTGARCLNHEFDSDVHISEEIKLKVFHLAIWTATLRATVARDRFTHEVTFKPFTEIGTRLSKQYLKLLMGICMFRRIDEATNEEYRILCKLARSTVPGKTEDFVYSLYRRGPDKNFTQSEMSKYVGLPSVLCGRLAENMTLLRVMSKKVLPGVKMEWGFSKTFKQIVRESEVYG